VADSFAKHSKKPEKQKSLSFLKKTTKSLLESETVSKFNYENSAKKKKKKYEGEYKVTTKKVCYNFLRLFIQEVQRKEANFSFLKKGFFLK